MCIQAAHDLCCGYTGTTVPLERRRELYKVAQDWNLIIIEDDAYYYLQYPNGAGESSHLMLDFHDLFHQILPAVAEVNGIICYKFQAYIQSRHIS